MDSIRKAKKIQAMHSFRNQFYYNLMFHSVLALTCSLLCSSPLWFPSLYSSMKNSLFLSLPNKLSSCFGPKCLFILVNVIVVFLVGESRLVGSQRSPGGEIYDEYLERSRSIRGVPTHQDEADKQETDQDQQTNIQAKEAVVKEQDKKEVTELSNEGGKDVHEEVEVEDDPHGEKEILEEEEGESGLPPEELNRRVEEFIARVNKQRWLEAQFLIC
ncbi:hypothetical protein SADUNF_Sadunf01G0045500 [Salix dunnii]|uniref:DUF4408 domain-containing protein n=1 Tax=Salix dunnii TaxID=1413687 RepID=A0A835N9Q0_9ROSI|nr:hypothetical protein SADUNF_Sadunf01G0045500 [Salix dunnii]